jgi:hypothetical protein
MGHCKHCKCEEAQAKVLPHRKRDREREREKEREKEKERERETSGVTCTQYAVGR